MSEEGDAISAGSREIYRWTCPLCEETNVGLATETTTRDAAVNALKSHVRKLDGDLHGPEHEFPDGLDPESLGQYVQLATEPE